MKSSIVSQKEINETGNNTVTAGAITKLGLAVQASGVGLWEMHLAKDDVIGEHSEMIWSDEFRKMLNYSDTGDFPNVMRSWSSRLHDDDRERVIGAFTEYLLDREGKTAYDIEYRLLKKTAKRVIFMLTAFRFTTSRVQ